jgi:hypothetical protein
MEIDGTGRGPKPDFCLTPRACQECCRTTHPIAGPLGVRSIGVEQPESHAIPSRLSQDNQSIGTDAAPPVAESRRAPRRPAKSSARLLNDEEVVLKSLELGEMDHRHGIVVRPSLARSVQS